MILKEKSKGVIALVVLSFGFALMSIFGRYLGAAFTPLQQLYLALGVGFLISLIIFPRTLTLNKLLTGPRKDWIFIGYRVILGYLLGGTMYRASLSLTKISNVTFIQSIPFAAILGFTLFKEKFTLPKFLLITLSFIGAVIISVQDVSSLITVGTGELLSFFSALIFSISYVSRKWQTTHFNDREMAQILLLLGFIVLFVVSIITGELWPPLHWDNLLLLSVIGSGFFNAINIFLINYGFRTVANVTASNIITLEAVFAVIMAYFFYREIPSPIEFIGGLFIIGSMITLNNLDSRHPSN